MESPTLPTRSQAPATRPRTPTRTGSPHSPTTSKSNLDDLCAKERKQIAIFINIYDIIYGRPIFINLDFEKHFEFNVKMDECDLICA